VDSCFFKRKKVHFTPLNNSLYPFDPLNKILALIYSPNNSLCSFDPNCNLSSFFVSSHRSLSLKLKFCIMIAHIKTYVKIIIKYFYIIYMYISLIAIKLCDWYEKVG
jgi:hypothetical protein